MTPEQEGVEITPEGPKGPTIPSPTLEQYFDSIKEPFRETQEGLAKETSIGWFVAGFMFCLIPLIPYAISKVTLKIFGQRIVSFSSLHFHLASFWFWWFLLFIV